jgi:hypothetical protein
MDTKLKPQKYRLKLLTVNAVRYFASPHKCLYGAQFIDVECCDEEFRKDLTRSTGASLTTQNEEAVLKANQQLAVGPTWKMWWFPA